MRKANRVIAIVLIILVAILYTETFSWSPRITQLPRLILTILGILSIILLITGGEKKTEIKEIKEESTTELGLKGIDFKRVISTIVATLVYIKLINVLGFYITTFVFLGVFYLVVGVKRRVMILVIPVILLIFFYGVFTLWLNVPLPQGVLY